MTHNMTTPITVSDEWLGKQTAASLSDAKQLLLDCQADIRPDVRKVFAASDHVAGALLESAPSEPLTDDFAAQLAARLQVAVVDQPHVAEPHNSFPDWLPVSLAAFMTRRNISLKWRAAGAGVQRARIMMAETGERIYLLRARAGFSVPIHSHRGEEWTLVLSGGYHVGGQGYVPGDLHQEDETCTHTFRVDDDGPCVPLIVDEGPLKFKSPLLKVIQPLLGI